MYKNILLAYDGSEGAKIALIKGAMLVKEFDSKLTALWVRERLPHYPETIDEISEESEAADEYENKLNSEIEKVEKEHNVAIEFYTKPGNPAKVILEYAKEIGADLIILGKFGHSGIWGNLLGHTADKVSENAYCDVLIIRD